MLSTSSRPRDLAAGLLLSLGVHALLLGGLAGAGVSVRGLGAEVELTTLLPEEISPRAQMPDVVPGNGEAEIDTSNWLGVDAPNEQQAPKSEVDQPELSINPGTEAVVAAPPLPAPVPKAALLPPQPVSTTPSTSEHSLAEAGSEPEPREAALGDIPLEAVAVTTPPPLRPAQSAAPTTPIAAGSTSKEAGDGAGLKSMSESAAAALKDAVSVVPGRVVSAKGLRVATKRPEWAATTRALRNPGNAVMQVTFGRDGTALSVRFLSDGRREYRTGYTDVDEPLMAALYQWTAQGDALLRLPEDDPRAGVTITFKILLTRG